jgi:muconolactone D-isomerase
VEYDYVLDPARPAGKISARHVRWFSWRVPGHSSLRKDAAMLFAVTMDVSLPPDLDPGVRSSLVAREKAYSQKLQRAGKWPHIWRIVGQFSNLSIFDVASHDELHEILWNLPLFPYMTIQVTALAQHPSDIAAAP